MKFCPHCGKGNQYQMPYCAHCGHQLVMGDSLNYKQAKKNFDAYMDAHPDEEIKFDQKHFQLCPNCHRKCLLTMDYCAWCGTKLNHQDQYQNYKVIITTSNVIPGFTYKISGMIWNSVSVPNDHSTDIINEVIKSLKDKCQENHGNTIIGFHLLVNDSKVSAYGTAVVRKPLKAQIR